MHMFGIRSSTSAGRLDAEFPCENIGSGRPLAKIVLEEFRGDDALGVENVGARVRDSELRGTLLDALIQDVESSNDLRFGIGKQRKRDGFAIREIPQDGLRIVTDRDYSEALGAEIREILFQLDQLGFAVRSPIGRTEEDQHGALWTGDRWQRLLPAVLIGRGKSWRLFPDCGPGLDGLRRQCRAEQQANENRR